MAELLVATGSLAPIPIPGGQLADIPKLGNDIRKLRLEGVVAPGQTFSGNFVECSIQNAVFFNVNLARADWKDCRVVGTKFEGCRLCYASYITNSFENCSFVECTFEDTGISDCKFSNCVFERCDFSHVIIKSSHFEDSDFGKCKTSNRAIESSLLIGTKWRSMQIDTRMITGNFGLLSSECEDCVLVTRGSAGESQEHSWEDLEQVVSRTIFGPIERLRLRLFVTESLEADAVALSAALNLRNWGRDAVVQSSLGAQLSTFAQFLLEFYSRDRVPIYPLLILHSSNFEMLEWLGEKKEAISLYQAVAGVHWVLSREVESFMLEVDALTAELADQEAVHFAANGPVDQLHFQNWLSEMGCEGVSVVSVRPRNSPVDLALSFINPGSLAALLALFLACRTRIELSRLPQPKSKESRRPGNTPQQLVSVSAGFLAHRAAEYELSLRTLLPRSLLLDLRLSMNVSVFQRAKGVLVHLLNYQGNPDLRAGDTPQSIPEQTPPRSQEK